MIKHIWFDFSDTLVKLDLQQHNQLRYSSYAAVVKKPLDEKLIQEYEEMLKKYVSNSGVFRALGLSATYWPERVSSVDPSLLYSLADQIIPEVLLRLKAIVPISLFTNINPEKILSAVGLNMNLFSYVIQAGMIKEPKPALEGFYKIIELTKEVPENILFVGDSLGKDIKPAKAVGLKTCLIWEKSAEADYSILKFDELLKFVK